MKNTDYNIDALSTMISSESGFNSLLNIISDLGLEITDIKSV